jgi:hypothetical protein
MSDISDCQLFTAGVYLEIDIDMPPLPNIPVTEHHKALGVSYHNKTQCPCSHGVSPNSPMIDCNYSAVPLVQFPSPFSTSLVQNLERLGVVHSLRGHFSDIGAVPSDARSAGARIPITAPLSARLNIEFLGFNIVCSKIPHRLGRLESLLRSGRKVGSRC